MKQLLKKSLLCVSASFFVCIAHAAELKPWTVLVYMAAANDLNQYALVDLQEMMQVGSNENVNIVAYLTLQEDGQKKVTKKLYIEQGSLVQIGKTKERDSGDVATLEEALRWACVDYPSEHIAVVLWDHGSGPLNRSKIAQHSRGVCYDFDTGHYLTDRDCLQAFSWARDYLRGGKKFDIVAFDACFLASLEMAYTLASCADYMVASQEAVPRDGYQYAYILQQLATTEMNVLDCAQLMVSAYKKEYVGVTNYTLSATDLNALDPLVDNCNAIAQILTYQLMGSKRVDVRSAIKKCVNKSNSLYFDDGTYIDLCQFYKNLLKNITRLQLSQSLLKQFKPMVIKAIKLFDTVIKANVTSDNRKQAGGLSVYFSRHSLDPSYYGLYWTKQNPNWLLFLEAFLS